MKHYITGLYVAMDAFIVMNMLQAQHYPAKYLAALFFAKLGWGLLCIKLSIFGNTRVLQKVCESASGYVFYCKNQKVGEFIQADKSHYVFMRRQTLQDLCFFFQTFCLAFFIDMSYLDHTALTSLLQRYLPSMLRFASSRGTWQESLVRILLYLEMTWTCIASWT